MCDESNISIPAPKNTIGELSNKYVSNLKHIVIQLSELITEFDKVERLPLYTRTNM